MRLHFKTNYKLLFLSETRHHRGICANCVEHCLLSGNAFQEGRISVTAACSKKSWIFASAILSDTRWGKTPIYSKARARITNPCSQLYLTLASLAPNRKLFSLIPPNINCCKCKCNAPNPALIPHRKISANEKAEIFSGRHLNFQ